MWAGLSAGESEDFFHAGFDDVLWGEERDGVEVALHRAAGADRAPAFVERDAPVEAEDVGACFAHRGEKRCSVDAEVDDGHAQGGARAGLVLSWGRGSIGGSRWTESAPAQESKIWMTSGTGFDLLLRVGDEHGDELFHEQRPGAAGGVHHLLGFDVVARAAAFDHVSWPAVKGAPQKPMMPS